MVRLTTDNPKGNLQTALNLFYAKDGQAWVVGGGSAPEYPDVTLYDYIRDMVKNHLGSAIEGQSNEEVAEVMTEWLFDGHESIEGLIATLYTAGWASAEIRERLKQYEDALEEGRMIELPCKVGDTVWLLLGKFDKTYDIVESRLVQYLRRPEHEFMSFYFDCAQIGNTLEFHREDFGRFVFLTREAAETALRKGAEK